MKLGNIIVEVSREFNLAEILGRAPIEIEGTDDLLLRAEEGMAGVYLRPVKGTVSEVKEGEGVKRIAGDNTFYCGEYKGQRFNISFFGYADHKSLKVQWPTQQNL